MTITADTPIVFRPVGGDFSIVSVGAAARLAGVEFGDGGGEFSEEIVGFLLRHVDLVEASRAENEADRALLWQRIDREGHFGHSEFPPVATPDLNTGEPQ